MNDVLYEDEQDGINDSRDELCLRATDMNGVGFGFVTELQVKVIFEGTGANALGKLYWDISCTSG